MEQIVLVAKKLECTNEEAVAGAAEENAKLLFNQIYLKLDLSTFSAFIQTVRDFDHGVYFPSRIPNQ